MADPIDVTITVDDADRGDLDRIAESARTAGLAVTAVLRRVGIISGTVHRSRIETLRTSPGVASVESATGFEVAPPDSPLQ
ncbi:MAG: hypothetical protein ICV72_04635 [Aldersonia sp.]|nr:hypothetical protein [Aldersonia sp.]